MFLAALLAMFVSTFNIAIWVAFVVLLVLYLGRRKARKAKT